MGLNLSYCRAGMRCNKIAWLSTSVSCGPWYAIALQEPRQQNNKDKYLLLPRCFPKRTKGAMKLFQCKNERRLHLIFWNCRTKIGNWVFSKRILANLPNLAKILTFYTKFTKELKIFLVNIPEWNTILNCKFWFI